MVCGRGSHWPAARQLRKLNLCAVATRIWLRSIHGTWWGSHHMDGDACRCISHAAVGVDLECRLIVRDVLPFLGMLCRRLGVELELVDPIPRLDDEPSEANPRRDEQSRAVLAISNARRARLSKALLAESAAHSIGIWYISLVGGLMSRAQRHASPARARALSRFH